MSALKIIAGLYKGRAIPLCSHPALRPTPNRVRETLFNWLMHDIHQSTCLDAFAGSGALGFEALSRGAKHVTLVEQDPVLFAQLQKTALSFNASALQLVQSDVLQFLATHLMPFDLIFLDPPFEGAQRDPCLALILERHLLTPEGLLYLETPAPPQPPAPWRCVRTKRAASVYYGLYTYHASLT